MKNVVDITRKKIKKFLLIASVIGLVLDLIFINFNLKSLHTNDSVEFWSFVVINILFMVTYYMFIGVIIEQHFLMKLHIYKSKLKFKKTFFYFKRSFELLVLGDLEKARYFYGYVPTKHDFYIGYLSGLSLAKFPENPFGLTAEKFSQTTNEIYNENISIK